MKKKTIIIIALVLIAIVSAALILKPSKVDVSQIDIQTAKAGEGTISNVVEATGTIEAITTVDVGTQVSGIIDKLFVDYNTPVKKGQLLAKIDTTNLAAQMEQSQASLDNAKAQLDYQQATYDRMLPLQNKGLISQTDYDQLIYDIAVAKANYKSALAQHKKNQIDLDYALIYSPIDGVVLNKEVEEGQTVAASFNTPTLFSIANDLTQMQVEANIDEADIGHIKEGQRVEFTVDAYPETIFEGKVTQLRWEPTVTNNVVTYTIIVDAPNPDYKLMPGMTATIEVYVLEKTDILVVPSKALRFTPDQKLMMSYMKQQVKPEMPKGQNPP
ncbi:efflux RND transporter periplasmic adaptor subunit [Prolixibacteraceae bacterium Z1-6]|uniref:Efflux RND transporter periplasmic adaptor subunit n=1 Tax=Draconibacterium aestuarii TaxID=2998507 RepID=A0A9X3FH25_9BACT|nr:efflux RND transporter periplasmic adaptor subunit [Prolixibacteraceae bacterium Z1-6]